MTHSNQITTPSVNDNIVNVIIEIPIGSLQKIEWNPKTKVMEVDRLEPTNFPFPVNYGFIPQTISGDKDRLDVIIPIDNVIPTNTSLSAKIIGIMKFEDEGKLDDKIVVVPTSETTINSLDDISKSKIEQITYFFNHYKDSEKPGTTIVKGWGNKEEAKEIISKSIERWKSNK